MKATSTSWKISMPDLVTTEEKARRKAVIKGWTFKIKNQYDVPFANHCMGYIKGYRNDPPAGYTDPIVPDLERADDFERNDHQ